MSSITVIAASIIAFAYGWKLALCLVVAVPLIVAVTSKQQKLLSRHISRDAKLMDNAGRVGRAGNV